MELNNEYPLWKEITVYMNELIQDKDKFKDIVKQKFLDICKRDGLTVDLNTLTVNEFQKAICEKFGNEWVVVGHQPAVNVNARCIKL